MEEPALTGNTLSIGDGFTYGIADIAITSDDDFHSSLSSPFSIAVVYSEISQGGIDSVIALISADGAWLFGSPQLIDTSHGEFHDVDIAYGYSSTQIPGGILAVGFLRDKHLGCSVPNGTILSAFSSPVYLDSLSSPNINNCYGFHCQHKRQWCKCAKFHYSFVCGEHESEPLWILFVECRRIRNMELCGDRQ